MKVKILELDKPNKNGRIYPTAVIAKSLESVKYPVFGELGFNPYGGVLATIDVSNISHKVENLRIEDGFLVGDVTVLKTPKGLILEQVISNAEFLPKGTGSIDKDGNISEYSLISVGVFNKDGAA
jgi:hypothetical protein